MVSLSSIRFCLQECKAPIAMTASLTNSSAWEAWSITRDQMGEVKKPGCCGERLWVKESKSSDSRWVEKREVDRELCKRFGALRMRLVGRDRGSMDRGASLDL